jgi:hypothetical protein
MGGRQITEADLARSLYLRNLPSTITELDIKLAFAKFGKVQKVTLLADHGYGFVYFYKAESIPLVLRHVATNPVRLFVCLVGCLFCWLCLVFSA